MIFPFESLSGEYREFGLVLAVLIGFGFGFVLERAGFGRATKLAGQFYGHDMTVFKVMFGAIVTAMLGVVIASGLGIVDLQSLSESVVSPTYVWPMLVGGLLLGVGFIVSGYCPGTSLVATASGNLDGLVTFVGVIVGALLYSEIQPLVQGFHNSGAQGSLFLYEVLGLPPAVVALMVVAMAVVGFFGAEWLERIFSKKRLGEEPQPVRRRAALATLSVATVVSLVTLFFPLTSSTASQEKQVLEVQPAQLAWRVFEEPWRMRILDIREEADCTKARVPGSECAPASTLHELGLAFSPVAKDIVVVPTNGQTTLPKAVSEFPGRVYILQGGFHAWKAYALTPPALPGPAASDEVLAKYRFQVAVHRSLTGAKAAPPPPRKAVKYVPKKQRKAGGCG